MSKQNEYIAPLEECHIEGCENKIADQIRLRDYDLQLCEKHMDELENMIETWLKERAK